MHEDIKIPLPELLLKFKEHLTHEVIEDDDDQGVTEEQKISARELIGLISEDLEKLTYIERKIKSEYPNIKKNNKPTLPNDFCAITHQSYKEMLAEEKLPVLLNMGNENSQLFDLKQLADFVGEEGRNPITNMSLTLEQLFSRGADRILWIPITEQEAQARTVQDAEKKQQRKANKLAFKALESNPNPKAKTA